MNYPLISVIVPIYNVEKYLPQCVDSVLQQTYKNIEVILLNDGSKDNSGSICQRYAESDSRVVYVNKLNSGVSDTRNIGLRKAKGEYIFFLDSDDYLDPKCFELLYLSSENGKLAMTGYYLDLTDENRILLPKQAYGSYLDMKSFILDFHRYYATKFNFVWGKLYITSIIRKHSIAFSQEILLGEDMLFNLDYYRYCEKGIVSISHNGYYYRQHGGASLSKKFDFRMFSWNEICYKTIREYLKEYDCLTEENRAHLYRNILGNYQYSFYLIALNHQMSMNEKVSLICKYLSTPIYQDSLSIMTNGRADYRLLNWLLQHRMIRSYIRLEQLKNKIRHGNNK